MTSSPLSSDWLLGFLADTILEIVRGAKIYLKIAPYAFLVGRRKFSELTMWKLRFFENPAPGQ